MATVLSDPGVRQNQQLTQFGNQMDVEGQRAVQNREQMGQSAVEQAMQYAQSRGISLPMAMDENPDLKNSVYTGLLYANQGNKNMADQMYNGLSGAKATRDQLFNYQMNKAIDGIDLDQPLFDQQQTYQSLVQEGGAKTIDGVTLDSKALMDLSAGMGENSAIWGPISEFVGIEASEYSYDEQGNRSALSWGEDFNPIREAIVKEYLGMPLAGYTDTAPGSPERAALNKKLINGMKNGGPIADVLAGVSNDARGAFAEKTEANASTATAKTGPDNGSGGGGGSSWGGAPNGVDAGVWKAYQEADQETKYKMAENIPNLREAVQASQSIDDTGGGLKATAFMAEGGRVGENAPLPYSSAAGGKYTRPGEVEGTPEANSSAPLRNQTFFQTEDTTVQTDPVYETINKTIPGWFSKYDNAEDLIRAQGGEAAQRSDISDVELRAAEQEIAQSKASTRLMGAQANAMITESMANPSMSETDRDNLETNRKVFEDLYAKQISSDFVADFKNVKDAEDWNNQVKSMYDVFLQYSIPLGTMQTRKEKIFGKDVDIYYLGGIGKEATANAEPSADTVAWAKGISG